MKPEQIKRILKKNNLTQHDLADKLGVTQQAVCDWIKGRRKMSKPIEILIQKLNLI